MSQKFIDIEKAIALKNPSLLKWMPGFLLRYVKRVTHEEWLNSVLNKHLSKKGWDFANALIQEFEMDVTVSGEENIPKTGGCNFGFQSSPGWYGWDCLCTSHW